MNLEWKNILFLGIILTVGVSCSRLVDLFREELSVSDIEAGTQEQIGLTKVWDTVDKISITARSVNFAITARQSAKIITGRIVEDRFPSTVGFQQTFVSPKLFTLQKTLSYQKAPLLKKSNLYPKQVSSCRVSDDGKVSVKIDDADFSFSLTIDLWWDGSSTLHIDGRFSSDLGSISYSRYCKVSGDPIANLRVDCQDGYPENLTSAIDLSVVSKCFGCMQGDFLGTFIDTVDYISKTSEGSINISVWGYSSDSTDIYYVELLTCGEQAYQAILGRTGSLALYDGGFVSLVAYLFQCQEYSVYSSDSCPFTCEQDIVSTQAYDQTYVDRKVSEYLYCSWNLVMQENLTDVGITYPGETTYDIGTTYPGNETTYPAKTTEFTLCGIKFDLDFDGNEEAIYLERMTGKYPSSLTFEIWYGDESYGDVILVCSVVEEETDYGTYSCELWTATCEGEPFCPSTCAKEQFVAKLLYECSYSVGEPTCKVTKQEEGQDVGVQKSKECGAKGCQYTESYVDEQGNEYVSLMCRQDYGSTKTVCNMYVGGVTTSCSVYNNETGELIAIEKMENGWAYYSERYSDGITSYEIKICSDATADFQSCSISNCIEVESFQGSVSQGADTVQVKVSGDDFEGELTFKQKGDKVEFEGIITTKDGYTIRITDGVAFGGKIEFNFSVEKGGEVIVSGSAVVKEDGQTEIKISDNV